MSNILTDEQLREIEERAAKASKDWTVDMGHDKWCITDGSGHTSDACDLIFINYEKENWGDEWDSNPEDIRDFVLHANTDIPALIATVREQWEYIKILSEMVVHANSTVEIQCPREEDPDSLPDDFDCKYNRHEVGSPVCGDYYREDHCKYTDGNGLCIIYYMNSLMKNKLPDCIIRKLEA